MKTVKFTINPLGPFVTPLQGDTFFGQLCWTALREWGEPTLERLLANYHSKPFVVVSDAFPSGYLPRPLLPGHLLGIAQSNPTIRKDTRRKRWIPVESLKQPVGEWMKSARAGKEIVPAEKPDSKKEQKPDLLTSVRHMHNSIDRNTGTTGENFAPYAVDEHWYAAGVALDLYCVLDEDQLTLPQLEQLVSRIGNNGYGKDANMGAGRFAVNGVETVSWPQTSGANGLLTLANCAPQGIKGLQAARSYYQPFTRYGRHGDWVGLVNPFKAPLLLAQTGSIFTTSDSANSGYFGQAIGGKGELSAILPATVHQGYAPVVAIELSA